MKMVWVKWRDSNYLFEQHSIDFAKAHKVAIFETVGHLVFEDADRIVVAGDVVEKQVRCITAIPKETIVEKRILNMEQPELCFFRMPDGSVWCTDCNTPPDGSEVIEVAPPGTPEGKVKTYPIPPNEG